MAGSFMVGESLVGDGNEVAHIDLLIGSKDGPVGEAFAEALINQQEGHTNLLAVVAPNLPAKPDTIMANKVTMKGATQAVQMFGPAQAAVARAVVDSVREGVIPRGPGRRPLPHRRRLHPLGRDRRQEDLRLQLPGDEGVDRPRPGQRAHDADGPRRRGRRRATRSPGEPRGSADAGPHVAAGRAPARRRPRGRHGREQRHRRRDRGGVRRRRRRRCSSPTAAARRPRARSPTRIAARRRPRAASRRPTSARAPAARRSSPRRASGSAASTCGSTTPAPTCSPARRRTGTGSASSTSCSPSTSRARSRAPTRPAP